MKRLWIPMLFAASSTSTFAQYIVNGSFETGNAALVRGVVRAPWVTIPAGGADTFDVTGVNGLLPGDAGWMTGATAHTGHVFTALASYRYIIKEEIIQTLLSPVTGGTELTVSAWIRSDPTHPRNNENSEMNILLYGGSTVTQVAQWTRPVHDGTWQSRSSTFVVPTGTWTQIAFQIDGSPNEAYLGIDTISVVPEPGTLAALGTAGLWMLRRRRR